MSASGDGIAEQRGEGGVDVEEAVRAGQRLVDAADGVLEEGAVARLGVGECGGALLDAGFEFIARGAHGLVGESAAFDLVLARAWN